MGICRPETKLHSTTAMSHVVYIDICCHNIYVEKDVCISTSFTCLMEPPTKCEDEIKRSVHPEVWTPWKQRITQPDHKQRYGNQQVGMVWEPVMSKANATTVSSS